MSPRATAIVTALITGGLALIGTVISVMAGNTNIRHELDKHQAVQDERIRELTDSVERHTGSITDLVNRLPKLEQKVDDINDRVKTIESRMQDHLLGDK